MNDQALYDDHDPSRRRVLQAAGATMLGGLAAADPLAAPATPRIAGPIDAPARNTGPLGARLQGVQHFGSPCRTWTAPSRSTRRCSAAPR